MPAKSPTRPGTLKLSEVARHLHVPTGIVSTGWPAVHRTCTQKLGISFDPWQDQAGRVILAKREDGHLAAMIDGVGLSLPRQVGKTYLIGALVFALCVNQPGLLVIWSAHHARTHGETFLAMQAFADRAKVRAHVRQVFTGSGDEEIRFINGSRILFGARERGFGRGIPGVDVLIFDEAQILSEKAMANMLATLNTSQFGLQLYIGTPPKPDDMSEAFTRMRAEALAKTLTDGAWIELGAEPDANPDDREQWRKANPSFPTRTPVQSIMRLKRKLTEADFLREGLGIWDDDSLLTALPTGRWRSLADLSEEPEPHVGRLILGIDSTPERTRTSIVAAGDRADGVPLLELIENLPGVDWALERVVELSKSHDVGAVVIDKRSTAATLIQGLKSAGIRVIGTDAAAFIASWGVLYDAVVETGRVRHLDQIELNEAVRSAGLRTLNEAVVPDRKRSTDDITPLIGAQLALWAHLTNAGMSPGRGRVVALS